GVVPQISAIFGACYGGPSFAAMQGDFSLMVKGQSYMGMSGVPVVKVGVNEEVTDEELGGSEVQSELTGQIDYVAEDEYDCLNTIKKYLTYFPQNCYKLPDVLHEYKEASSPAEVTEIIPEKFNRAYDMESLIKQIVDKESLFYYKKSYAK